MKAPSSSSSSETGGTRRLLITLLITTAAAAVTGGVALNDRHPARAVAERIGARPALAVAPSSDPSLPAASEVLKEVPAGSGEPAPTS
jgi:hypothetical protein